MKISLNLATRPFTDLGPILHKLRVGMALLAVLSAGSALGLHLLHDTAEQARKRTLQLDTQIARVTGERQGYQALMHQPDNERLVAETGALNDLIDLKTFSWTLAMENLETVLPAGVQVLTLEPQREKDGRITVHLLVGGPREKVEELVRGLEHSARFRNPYIKGETAEQANSGGPQQRLEPVTALSRFNFDIMADYNPPAEGETKPKAGVKADAKADIKNGAKADGQPNAKSDARHAKPAGGAR
jgi:type IV pilus assembly protein PilN